jgi:hypothetical protein
VVSAGWPPTSSATVNDSLPSQMLRVTQDEHGGDIHEGHVEPDIPGA